MAKFIFATFLLCMTTLSILHVPVNSASVSSFAANNHLSEQEQDSDIETTRLINHQYLRKLSKDSSSKSSKKSKSKKESKGKSSSKSKSKKSNKSATFPNLPSLDCYLLNEGLGENQTAASPEECTPLYDSILSLQDGSFPRENFAEFFTQLLLPGIEDFIMKGTMSTNPIVNYDLARDRLEKFIFDGVPLDMNDFSELLAAFPAPPVTGPDMAKVAVVSEKPEDIAAYKRDALGTKRAVEQYLVLPDDSKAVATWPMLKNEGRALINDDDLSPECLDAIVRIIIEVIGIFLSAVGIRGIVLRPFKEYFVTIKGGQLNGLVLTAYRQSRGEFDASFFVGLVVSFLSILTWDDIKSALNTLDSTDWLSLALGLSLSIGSVMATGGLALSLAITGIFIQADSLRGDIAALENCFRLCSDGFTQSGGQQTTTYTILLDRSQGKLNLYYQMYSIPDRLDLIYEGTTIFTTGGLVSGSQTIQRDIDGDAKEILVRITAPNSGTAWVFSIDCPVPNIL